MWEQMCTYQDIDTIIVRVVRQSQHLWYLTEHFVIPAFLKEVMATQVHLYPPIPKHALKLS